jgi:hypothetical protein
MHRSPVAFIVLVGVAAPALLAILAALDTARAQDAPLTLAGPGRQVCRIFETDLRAPHVVDTDDRTSEVGQWVGQQRDAGLTTVTVDLEVGQKPTGYPQGYLSVCVGG